MEHFEATETSSDSSPTIVQVGNRTITAQEIIPLLTQYQLLPQLVQELAIDEAIASLHCTPEEQAIACQQFAQQHQLSSEDYQAWLERWGMTPDQFQSLAVRWFKIEKFKQATWDDQVKAYYFERQGQLDRVVYSLIRTQDAGVAHELYFRLQEEEQSFAELAHQHSQGAEAQTGGLIGPVEMGQVHPVLAQRLRGSKPGQLWSPIQLGEWLVIIKLERFLPAQLNEKMWQRLRNELFDAWLQEQLP